MKQLICAVTIVLLVAGFIMVSGADAEQKGKPIFGSTDPSEYFESKN